MAQGGHPGEQSHPAAKPRESLLVVTEETSLGKGRTFEAHQRRHILPASLNAQSLLIVLTPLPIPTSLDRKSCLDVLRAPPGRPFRVGSEEESVSF